MLDVFNINGKYKDDVQIFTAAGASYIQEWQKPPGCTMCFMLNIGGGAGGGAGFSRAAGNPGGGGGGGYASQISKVIIPLIFLPDRLFINVALGGAPGMPPSTIAENGRLSFISTSPTTSTTLDCIIASQNAVLSGGNNGSSGAGGSASSTPSAFAQQSIGNTYGVFSTLAATSHLAGVAGGAHTGAAGSSITSFVDPTGGAGGAGCTTTNFAGGSISITSALFSSVAGGTAGGGDGAHGYSIFNAIGLPSLCTGGAGGGSNNSGTAGNGGDGGIGCGGGGGGAGVTGGRGGYGGNGFVAIICW